jgi:hypothetical protein
MSDRLPELRRQRALIAEHLAWLDREIAAAGGETSAAPATRPPVTLPPPADPGAAVDPLAAEKILAEFRREAELSPTKMRRGCIWSFVAAMALFILGVAAIYWLRYR